MSRPERDPGAGEADDRPTGAWLAVAAILAVALVVVGGVAVAELFLTTGDTLEENVQAGASVSTDASVGNTTVTWTANQNADFLVVRFAEGGEAMRVAEAPDGQDAVDEGVVLSAVGQSVVFTERPPTPAPATEQATATERANGTGQTNATATGEPTRTPRTVQLYVVAVEDGDEDGTVSDGDAKTVILDEELEV